jgi:NitT/TauT family transport system substrate-binding protein
MSLWSWSLAVIALCFASAAARADTTLVKLGYGPTTDFASAFVAQEEGLFRAHGLDVQLTLIPGTAAIPAAVAGSVDVVNCTPAAFFQAIDGGIELEGIAGGSLMSKEVNDFTGLVARKDSNVHAAKDLVGKRVGVPGLTGTLFVLFKEWLRQQHIDDTKITFIEIPFPNMADALRSGSIDAAIPIDPILSRILGEGIAYRVANYMESAPDNLSAVFYCSTAAWAKTHADTVRAFKAAIADAVVFMGTHPDQVRPAIAKYVKMPPDIMAKIMISHPTAELTVAQLRWWYDTMQKQGGIQGKIDIAHWIEP